MQTYKVVLLSPAWLELDAISDFHLLTVGVNSAKKVTDKILESLQRLETFPLSCPLLPFEELALQGYRMLVCGKYICIYKLVDTVVYVYHIAAAGTNYSALFDNE